MKIECPCPTSKPELLADALPMGVVFRVKDDLNLYMTVRYNGGVTPFYVNLATGEEVKDTVSFRVVDKVYPNAKVVCGEPAA